MFANASLNLKISYPNPTLWVRQEKKVLTEQGSAANARKSCMRNPIVCYRIVESEGGHDIKLKSTRMHYVDQKTCNASQAKHGRLMAVPNHLFCMIGTGWSSDCFGDSGSGILWKRYIVGVVSAGRDSFCGSDVMPSMYTDVVYFRGWLNAKIKTLESLDTDNIV